LGDCQSRGWHAARPSRSLRIFHAVFENTDIVPVGSSTNVTGVITDGSGVKSYGASKLAQPLDGTTVFYDALWNIPLNQGTVQLVTFGTDTHLQTAPGWDDVTGTGVPKPKPFADFFKP
jgi:hypothetical protein